jgi:hypothetical protein
MIVIAGLFLDKSISIQQYSIKVIGAVEHALFPLKWKKHLIKRNLSNGLDDEEKQNLICSDVSSPTNSVNTI